MLELNIMIFLIGCETKMSLKRSRVVGFQIAWMINEYGIPRGTFYRAVNQAIESDVITRTQRGHYALSDNFRELCNRVPDGHFVKAGK